MPHNETSEEVDRARSSSPPSPDFFLQPTEDLILACGFENGGLGGDAQPQQEIWIAVDNNSITDTTVTGVQQRRAALIRRISTPYLREQSLCHYNNGKAFSLTNGDFFPNGYSIQKVSNLYQLRDALINLLPSGDNKTLETKYESNKNDDKFLQHEVTRFELFRRVIEHEDDLLNQRVSWIILAQSFLMAAFITSSGADSLRYVTAVVGLLTVVVTMPAILAAGRNIEIQQKVYFAQLSKLRCQTLHGHPLPDEWEQRRKHGHLFPTMSFRDKHWSIPILNTVIGLCVLQVLGWCFLLVALWLDW